MKPAKETKNWYVYILRCCDDTLYTGITTHLGRRLAEHNSPGSETRYTRSRQPVEMVYYENAANRSEAGKREYRIKKMARREKEMLISSESHHLEGPEAQQ
ncbi:GIY-YIG nuclease family protein [Desulfopila sp. IMCC35008]|uniref:GIY-YIG nuclease family protein n=1 Tax=Desulfopila sp. IMCC35008 TaxID=2653858 RepID=UPI0013D522D0|nr:GIY-YIG nuclease family protein [Desulfopila sp. IMCC35008]